ncbi:mitochondrial carrier [Dentipellis sp. KUC8613]|nr:mitochondrial carrier [Dentipellis sp. KUC8613]
MSERNGKEPVPLDPTLDFFAGTVAGVAALLVGHPFDTVKVRFQNPATASKYRSTFHAFATIAREERVLGLYKGVTSPLASCALLNGLVFATYRTLMKLQLRHEGEVPTLWQINLAGAGCGLISSIITTPIELIKIRQQQSLIPIRNLAAAAAAPRAPHAPTALALAASIYRERGLRGLYRGITATGLRDIGYGAYFAGYEAAIRLLTPAPPYGDPLLDAAAATTSPAATLSWPRLLLAGGVAGIAGWVFTFPFDVVKTRVQSSADGSLPASASSTPASTSFTAHAGSARAVNSSTPGEPSTSAPARPYRNTLSTIAASYRAEGARVFVRGLAPTLIRAIPVNMVTFATFEAVVHACS